jgi:hypothetical protein
VSKDNSIDGSPNLWMGEQRRWQFNELATLLRLFFVVCLKTGSSFYQKISFCNRQWQRFCK